MYRYFYLIRREGLELRWEDVERDFVVLISTREGQNVTLGGTPPEGSSKNIYENILRNECFMLIHPEQFYLGELQWEHNGHIGSKNFLK
jgi:hypothetical protein